jgi:RNA polymerase sigma-70 factor (ECF subfamily)
MVPVTFAEVDRLNNSLRVGLGGRSGVLALELDLAEVVVQAQSGDQAAFAVIYEHFAEPLFHYLLVRCRDAALAEELTGDLWMRVVERLPAFRCPRDNPQFAFAGWLYQIARNLAIDAYRRQTTAQVPLAETIASGEVPLDDRVIGGEDEQELCAALAKLTPEQREVLLLRFIEERSTAEVAAITGRSEGAVKVMQHRALGAVARVLGVKRGKAH